MHGHEPKKGSLRHGHEPKKEILVIGTTRKKGGLTNWSCKKENLSS